MPAHTRTLVFGCSESGCGKQATVEVYTTWNDPVGKYCKPHGERQAARLRERESGASK